MSKKIRVLIVDDSMLFLKYLNKKLNQDFQIEVVGTARDPFEARDKIVNLKPDVLTLDVEMPKMNGIEFLKKLLPQYYIPTIMVSSVNEKVFEALEAGAVDFVKKPQGRSEKDLEVFVNHLIRNIKAGVISNRVKGSYRIKNNRSVIKEKKGINEKMLNSNIVVIGASTGGTNALLSVIKSLPVTFPPVLVVQHMPPVFTNLFANRVNKASKLNVIEAENRQLVKENTVYIAPGGFQMEIEKTRKDYFISIRDGESVNGHKPSVDVLFNSACRNVKKNIIGILLTGMGRDGAQGLLNLKKNGAKTIGQDEETCVVYGMPRVAYEIGAIDIQKSIEDIPSELVKSLRS